jgi:phage tail protein X
MPCHDPRSDSDDTSVRRELNERTAMLCELCGRLESSAPEMIAGNPVLAEWWEAHKEFDGIRAILPPSEIVEAAETVRLWMERNGYRNWQLGGICDRRFAYKASPK